MQTAFSPGAGQAVVFLPDAAATDRLGAVLAGLLRPGATVLLSGPVGAGKSHLARRVIRSRFGPEVEVPSPTYTLVQTYEDENGALRHADLYRLSSADELVELGLDTALGSDICLIEWPERLGTETPHDAIAIDLSFRGEGREARLSGPPAQVAAIVAALADNA